MNTNNNELETMRQQLRMLKDEVSKKNAFNLDMMKELIKSKTDNRRKYALWRICVAVPVMIVVFPWLFHNFMGLSWPLTIFGILLTVGYDIFGYWMNCHRIKRLYDGELTATAEELAMRNQLAIRATGVTILVAIIFFVWFYIEVVNVDTGILMNLPKEMLGKAALLGVACGIVGVACGILSTVRRYRTNQELMKRLENFRND